MPGPRANLPLWRRGRKTAGPGKRPVPPFRRPLFPDMNRRPSST